MADLYSNENIPLPLVYELRRLGHDVLTSYEAGQANQSIPDNKVLEFAKQNGRAVITLNRKDFVKLHLRSSNHLGIILCSEEKNHSNMAKRINRQIKANNPLPGKLLRVNRNSPI
ncbi:MAG: DUF5615 family PIN-like protein [Thermodesulfobacteriota bacterium]